MKKDRRIPEERDRKRCQKYLNKHHKEKKINRIKVAGMQHRTTKRKNNDTKKKEERQKKSRRQV